MVITIFRSRLDTKNEAEYRPLAERMREIAMSMPGLVSFKSFAADDGERLSMIVFDSVETQKAWREHPEHREAQRLGWASFYSEFSVVVCDNPRVSSKGNPSWAQATGRLE
jgi:heme-degrading monooxygenase HmoA